MDTFVPFANCRHLYLFLTLLLLCAIPVRSHAQSGLPSVTTGSESHVEGQGDALSGTAWDNNPGLPYLYTWFQWGLTTNYDNVTPQVFNPPFGAMYYIIPEEYLQPNTVYHYQAVASNSYGTSYGADATWISPGPPTINTSPQSQAVAVGATVTFTVGASASDGVLFYQWEKDGVDIFPVNDFVPSGTATLTISNVQYSDAGTYTAVVASDYGGMEPISSAPAVLTVGSGPPMVTLQPTNQTVTVGSTVSLTPVITSGVTPFTFQWQWSGTNLDGATNLTLTLTNVTFTQAGTYSVIVSNSVASVQSSTALLTVAWPPFFNGAASLGENWYYLQSPSNNLFGYYSLGSFPYVYHLNMGFEYFVDANNAHSGAYFYDFTCGAWFYTEPNVFPYLYDFNRTAWLYYCPDANNPGNYTSNPRWFYDFSANLWTTNLTAQ